MAAVVVGDQTPFCVMNIAGTVKWRAAAAASSCETAA
jgi:hypothetical protein